MSYFDNIIFHINEKEIIQIFSSAIARLYKNDFCLFESGVQERALQFRLGVYLRELFLFAENNGLSIDVEYNRDGEKDAKRPNPEKSVKDWFAPDIILHERGSKIFDYRNDIIYCEIKKDSKSGSSDATKIKQQMKIRKYQYGIDLFSLKKDKIELDVYKIEQVEKPKRYIFNFKTCQLESFDA
jgi:hypothetical protein